MKTNKTETARLELLQYIEIDYCLLTLTEFAKYLVFLLYGFYFNAPVRPYFWIREHKIPLPRNLNWENRPGDWSKIQVLPGVIGDHRSYREWETHRSRRYRSQVPVISGVPTFALTIEETQVILSMVSCFTIDKTRRRIFRILTVITHLAANLSYLKLEPIKNNWGWHNLKLMFQSWNNGSSLRLYNKENRDRK